MSLSCLVDINALLDSAEPFSMVGVCIYKVPSAIRTLNEKAYTPTLVSIGPFHHDHHQLQNMERHKLIYFKAFHQRTNASLDTLVSNIKSNLSRFKSCYSETLSFSDNELVKLILIDSCFIIQLFWTYYYDDGFLFKPWLDDGIALDLLLLENQLPFFVIEEIYKLSSSSTNASVPKTKIPCFLELTIKYFYSSNKSNLFFDNGDISILHFTDLIRIFHLQLPIEIRQSSNATDERMIHLPSATELLEAGVRFKVSTKSKCLLDLRFSKSGGVLEIPQLTVDDRTEILFRNMVALEQCHYPYESYITDYVVVLDYLINTGKDVDILVPNKILENWLGDSDSVANLITGLCKNVTHCNSSPHFTILCEDLQDFCRNPWPKFKYSLIGTLRRDYCSTPWKAGASFAGILLLILTIIQTVCSVFQVVQPNGS